MSKNKKTNAPSGTAKPSNLAGFLYLNLLWFLCCIPVVTIGPATSALYSTLLLGQPGDLRSLTTQYSGELRRHLKKGLIFGIGTLLAGALIAYNLYMYVWLKASAASLATIFQIVLSMIYLVVVSWLFGVIARFNGIVQNLLLFTIFVSIRHFIYTMGMLAVQIAVVLAGFYVSPFIMIPGLLVVNYVNAVCFHTVFSKYKIQGN